MTNIRCLSCYFLQGGLVTAGLDIAQLWLDGEETLVYTTDKDRHIFPINMVDGHAITHDPLVILVSICIRISQIARFVYCFISINHVNYMLKLNPVGLK